MTQHSRSLAGVKQVGNVDAKVPLQPDDVPISSMHDFDDLQGQILYSCQH